MMKKSFREQLQVVAEHIGLKSNQNDVYRKYIDLNSINKSFKMKIFKQWESYGRNEKNQKSKIYYSEADNVCKMLDELLLNNEISNEACFYSYVGYLKLNKQINCHLQPKFRKQLTKSVALISFSKDNRKYQTIIQNIGYAIDENEFERLRVEYKKQQEMEKIRILKEKRVKEKNNAIKSLWDIVSVMDKIKKEILNIPLSIPHPQLNNDDILLSLSWDDRFLSLKDQLADKKISFDELSITYEKNYELGRLLSARSAEIAVKLFYQKYGFLVEDTSLFQLEENQFSSAWKYYDLDVENWYPITPLRKFVTPLLENR